MNSNENIKIEFIKKVIHDVLKTKYSISIDNISINNHEGDIDISTGCPVSSNSLSELSTSINHQLDKKYFIKLMSIAGLHSETTLELQNNAMKLQRIKFFVSDSNEKLISLEHDFDKLNEYDHRVLNRDMHLFHIDPCVSPGAITWLPKGTMIVNQLKEYIRSMMSKYGYQEIITPAFANGRLWQDSGHWDMYKENMIGYNSSIDDIQSLIDRKSTDVNMMCLKPMSCPLHCEVFKQMQLSYKQLPLKLFEFGLVHRNEPSGSLHGLSRTKLFTQDDAHVFCNKNHIKDSVIDFCTILRETYNKCGFNNIKVKLSTRPDVYAGYIEVWDVAEQMLQDASVASGLDFEICKGDGAFYGPKLEFHLLDQHNRSWQCGTLQLDLILAERLNVTYINDQNQTEYPVLIHHAVLGSIERFFSILIEHHRGRLPMWLAPVQIKLVTVNENVTNYAYDINNMLIKHGFRSEVDDTNNTLSYKIRKAKRERIPFICTIGSVECEKRTIAIRDYDKNIISISEDELIEFFNKGSNT